MAWRANRELGVGSEYGCPRFLAIDFSGGLRSEQRVVFDTPEEHWMAVLGKIEYAKVEITARYGRYPGFGICSSGVA